MRPKKLEKQKKIRKNKLKAKLIVQKIENIINRIYKIKSWFFEKTIKRQTTSKIDKERQRWHK